MQRGRQGGPYEGFLEVTGRPQIQEEDGSWEGMVSWVSHARRSQVENQFKEMKEATLKKRQKRLFSKHMEHIVSISNRTVGEIFSPPRVWDVSKAEEEAGPGTAGCLSDMPTMWPRS